MNTQPARGVAYQPLENPGSKDCVFCRIVRDELPARRLADATDAVAFLDAKPIVRGHTLVVPRAHAVDLFSSAPVDLAAALALAQLVSQALVTALDAEGCNLWQTNGGPAGQTIPHVHLHILPRQQGDRGLSIFPERQADATRRLDELAQAVRLQLSANTPANSET